MTTMSTFLIVTGLVVITLIAGRVVLSIQFRKDVRTLFSQSGEISGKTFSYKALQDLPEPVQRYFRHVMKDGQPYISYIRLRHDGKFKTAPDRDWMNIEGEQYFTTQRPGFIWKGSTRMFTARDMYVSDKGKLAVFLFSIFKIAGGQGEKYDQGELLRWLGESVWFPTNLLPGENLQWTAIDNHSAQLNFKYNNHTLSYLVTFNEAGEISELQTKRYMGDGNLETWIGKLSDYKAINGIVIPTTIEAIYRLKEKDYSYAKFNVKTIEYNIPASF